MDLVVQTDEARRNFESHPVILDAVANGMALDRYRVLLSELYSLVWHFNPTCAAAASRIPEEYGPVRSFLYEHMHEEAGHEQWVLNDLEAVGVSREASLAYSPSAHVLALNGYNYWAADRKHPCSILGMMYVLEVIASVYGGPFSAAMKEALLLQGERGVSFINSHASLDAGHMAQLRIILNTLASEQSQAAVIESTLVNFNHVTHIFGSV
ncbi:MAG: iron-containing redox enzyme family protein [Thermoanaerobaculia bacterium]